MHEPAVEPLAASPAPGGGEFVFPVSVRYLEVDAQGVVFNMWYLAYVDDAMTAFLAAHGLSYRDLVESGHDVQLVHAELDWRGGLRWADPVGVAVRLVSIGSTSFRLGFEFRRAGEPVATAEVVYVCVATGGGKRPIPASLRAGLGVPTADGPPGRSPER